MQSVLRIFLLVICFALILAAHQVEAQTRGVSHREISFLSDDTLLLHGTLWLPAQRKTRVPCVVFVHGSGPQTRDEASKVFVYDSSFRNHRYDWSKINIQNVSLEVGRAKILMALLGKDTLAPGDGRFVRYEDSLYLFRDIAVALAHAGIASLTYDKRSYTYGKKLLAQGLPADPAALGGLDDYVRDLEVTVQFVRRQSEIDPQRIFLLGHSEGASGIAQRAALDLKGLVRGVILLAASSEPIDATFHDQLQDTQAGTIVDSLLHLIRTNAPHSDNFWVLNASGSYWKSWMRMTDSTVAYTKAIKCPMLLIQGGLDLNVHERNAEFFDSVMMVSRPKKDYEVKIYPGLDHFMRLPWEKQVDERVPEAIIRWVKNHS